MPPVLGLETMTGEEPGVMKFWVAVKRLMVLSFWGCWRKRRESARKAGDDAGGVVGVGGEGEGGGVKAVVSSSALRLETFVVLETEKGAVPVGIVKEAGEEKDLAPEKVCVPARSAALAERRASAMVPVRLAALV